MLEDNEAILLEVYKRKLDNQQRYLTIKGISNDKYAEHKEIIEGKINFFGQNQPGFPAKYARSFLSIFYYKGDMNRIVPGMIPGSSDKLLDAFANGEHYAEWLTHNSGVPFNDVGVSDIEEYTWDVDSEVSKFFADRTPFVLERIVSNTQGYYEFATDTGTALKNFYDGHVKAAAENALRDAEIGETVRFPQDGGWYEFPRAEDQNLFKSDSPDWVTPATMVIGKDDGYSGFGALVADLMGGTDAFQNFDAFGAIGRGRVVSPRYQITVKKEQTGIWPFESTVYNVSSVLFECAIEDLYDFNYEDGELPSHAAAMQIGFGKGVNGAARDQGMIYRHRINLRMTYGYPFLQTVIPSFGP